MQAIDIHQRLDEHREDEAASSRPVHADAVRQGSVLVEVLRHYDYTRSGW